MQHSNHRTAALIASKPARIITSAALAVALTATPMLSPVAAYAASQATQDQLAAAQQKIEAATSAYNDARTKLGDLQKQIDANEASIEKIEAKLPDQQEKACTAMRDLYKYQKGTNPIVSFLVNAQSLGEFITTCKYTNQITSSSVDEIEELNNMQTELEQNKAELQQAKSQLEAEQKNAEEALAQAQQLRSRLLGEVVLRGAEATGGDHDVAAREREGERVLHPLRVIAHRRVVVDRNAQRLQPAREVLRVRVDDLTHQQLRADGDDFRDHAISPLPARCGSARRTRPSSRGSSRRRRGSAAPAASRAR